MISGAQTLPVAAESVAAERGARKHVTAESFVCAVSGSFSRMKCTGSGTPEAKVTFKCYKLLRNECTLRHEMLFPNPVPLLHRKSSAINNSRCCNKQEYDSMYSRMEHHHWQRITNPV
jgi:hypothetical protein